MIATITEEEKQKVSEALSAALESKTEPEPDIKMQKMTPADKVQEIKATIEAIPKDIDKLEIPEKIDPILKKLAFIDTSQSELLLEFIKEYFRLKDRVIKPFRDKIKSYKKNNAQKKKAEIIYNNPDLSLFEKIINKEGKSCFYGEYGITAVNQFFFAEYYNECKTSLFEPTEQDFYEYDDKTGLWELKTIHNVKRVLSEQFLTINNNHICDSDVLRFRTDALLNSIIGGLKGKIEKKDAFKKKTDFFYIHVENGVIELTDLNQITLKPFSKEYYSRNQSPYVYDPKAECPLFINTLLKPQMNNKDMLLFQKWCGSVLLGGNIIQKLFIMSGEPGGGKGTIVEIVEEIIGRQNVTELRTNQLEERFELFAYVGKTLLAGKDTPGDFLQKKGAYVIKKLVGHDWVTMESKGGNKRFDVRGEFDIVINANSRLHVKLDGDIGAWKRRLIITEFKNPPVKKVIPNYSKVLLKKEGAGILNWMVRGAVLLLEDIERTGSIEMTEAQKNVVETLLCESDSVKLFVENCLVISDKDTDISVSELVESYIKYCSCKKWKNLPIRVFETQSPDIILSNLGLQKRHDIKRNNKSVRGYSGLSIVSDTSDGSRLSLSDMEQYSTFKNTNINTNKNTEQNPMSVSDIKTPSETSENDKKPLKVDPDKDLDDFFDSLEVGR